MNMPVRPLPRAWRYGIVLAGILLATLARLALIPVLGGAYPFATFFLVVVLAAWYLGLGPSVLSLVLGTTLAVASAVPGAGLTSGILLSGIGYDVIIAAVVILISEDHRATQRHLELEVSERRRTEADLHESEALFRRLASSIGDVFWMSDPDQRRLLYVSPAYETVWGRSCAAIQGDVMQWIEAIHPEDRARVEATLFRRVEPGGYDEQYRVVRPDGSIRWVRDRGFPVLDTAGTMVQVAGVAEDITERRRDAERMGELQAALQRRVGELETLLDLLPVGVAIAEDPECRSMRANRHLLKLLNARPGTNVSVTAPTFEQPPWWIVHQGRELCSEELPLQRCAALGEEVHDEECDIAFDDGRRARLLVSATPLRDDDGRAKGCVGVLIDITERQRSEEISRFLAHASISLAELVDPESTMQRMARLAVPFFCDWCLIDLIDEEGTIHRAAAHADPQKEPLIRRLIEIDPPDEQSRSPVLEIMRSGHSRLVEEISDDLLREVARSDEHEQLLRELGSRSAIGVPLVARGRTLGAMAFLYGKSSRRYGPRDLALAEDLARRAAIAIETARLYQELKDSDRRKDEFLAVLAHELRNPLAPIRNALQLLADPSEQDEDSRLSLLAMMDRQVLTLARLVDDLMDVSRINRGKVDLRLEDVELATLVDRAVGSVAPLIAERNQDLVVSLLSEAIWLRADPTRLEQVLWNLLHNASKYTDPGGRIELTVERGDGPAVLRVRDTGIGIEPEMIRHIFDPFTQVEQRRERSQGGLGIGLNLVRSLVSLHGGTIEAHSAGPGCGSEFVLHLPVSESPPPEPVRPVRTLGVAPGSPLPCRRVLVVDDDHDSATSLARILSRLHGQEVRIAHDGPSALAVAEEFHPEVVLMDVGLPGMNGYEAAARLRAQPWSERTVLVAVTGWGLEPDRQHSREAGFHWHMLKPLDPNSLLDILAADPVAPGKPA